MNNNTLNNRYPNDLAPLHDLDDWKVADGEVDPRGMDLVGGDDQKLGTIDTLLASPSTRKAHFAIVQPTARRGERFAIPLDEVRFDAPNRRAYAPYLGTQFNDAPAYTETSRDYDAYNTYWVGVLEREPEQPKNRQKREQHHDFDNTFKLYREELQPTTQEVQTGEVRVHKDVVSETKTVEVPVEREEVIVKRHKVENGQAVEGRIGDDQEIRVPVHEEQVRLNKQTVVAEEVEIDTRRVQDKQKVSGEVRREEVRVDTEGDVEVNRNAKR